MPKQGIGFQSTNCNEVQTILFVLSTVQPTKGSEIILLTRIYTATNKSNAQKWREILLKWEIALKGMTKYLRRDYLIIAIILARAFALGFNRIGMTLSSIPSMADHSTAARDDEVMRVKRLSENAILPVRSTEHAAGFDLAAAHSVIVPPRGKALVKTDCAISIPIGTYARVAPRSGLAWKRMIDTGAGVIDYDYRGNVGVVLFNHGTEEFVIEPGDRIAQLILERISMADAIEVDELPESLRGEGGFGSTGGSDALKEQKSEHSSHPTKRKQDSESVDIITILLDFISTISSIEEFGMNDEDIRSLKVMALNGDERFRAIRNVYMNSQDTADLKDSLKILLHK